jgi:hypothetical protein
MKEKRIEDVSLEDAYAALLRADYINQFKRRNLGPVSEWDFVVLHDTNVHLLGRFIVVIPEGTYTMVRNEATRQWITLMLPEELNGRT